MPLSCIPWGHHLLAVLRYITLGTQNDLQLTTIREVLSLFIMHRVHTIVLLLMWLPPHSQYCPLFLSFYPPRPTTSTPLLSVQLLPLCTKSKLINPLTPATPKLVCRSGVHKLTLHRKKTYPCRCHSSPTTVTAC